MRLKLASLALCAVLASGAGVENETVDPTLAPENLNEQVLRLPGDPQRPPVALEVTLFKPPGPGPFPLAVMNHGATRVTSSSRGERYRNTYSAFYFLSRGYAVALPMARGFAGSGGELFLHGCDVEGDGLANARDLAAVIDGLGRLPGIDRARTVVAGQSFGGWTTLALGTLNVPGVRGLVAFSPAVRDSSCGAQDGAMASGARAYGAGARLPSLWFYGDNDTVMPPQTWHAVLDAYTRGGGRAELVEVGRLRGDSHQMLTFPETIPMWTAKVDAFLGKVGLPSTETNPEYLPIPRPPPTGFAELSDASAVPFVNDKGRDSYRQFLSRKLPRVFALSSGGVVSVADGGFDPLARALLACRKAGAECRPYAYDDQIVWAGGREDVRAFSRSVPAGAATVLNFASAVNPDCSSRGVPKLRVSQPPAHGGAAVSTGQGHPGFPAGSPFAKCNASLVPGASVTYAPAAGYSGQDAMTFEETDVDGGRHVFRMSLTVQ